MSFEVVDRIIKNEKLSMTDKMILIALASFGDNKGGSIFPCHNQVAKRAGSHKRTVIRAIDSLIEKGYLNKEKVFQDNLKKPNKYYIALDKLQCDRESHRCDRESLRSDRESLGGSDRESHKPTIITQPITQPFKKSIKKDFSKDFETFWMQCPKKVGKGAAFKAYQKALKNSEPSEILRGMMFYAAKEIDPKFIKHPCGWLNDERWKDEEVKPSEKGKIDGTYYKKQTLSEKHREEAARYQEILDRKYRSCPI